MKFDRWDLPSLVGKLASSDAATAAGISIEVPESVSHAAIVSLSTEPGLQIVTGVDGGEIQFSVLLEPVVDVPDAEKFNRALLKANKLMSLSTFGITEIDGVEYYEVFGQMSSASDLAEVVEEIQALGKNAEDALEMIVEWQNGRA